MLFSEAHAAGTAAKAQLLLVPRNVSGSAVCCLKVAIVQGIHLHSIVELCAKSMVLDSPAPWNASRMPPTSISVSATSGRHLSLFLISVGSTRIYQIAQICASKFMVRTMKCSRDLALSRLIATLSLQVTVPFFPASCKVSKASQHLL